MQTVNPEHSLKILVFLDEIAHEQPILNRLPQGHTCQIANSVDEFTKHLEAIWDGLLVSESQIDLALKALLERNRQLPIIALCQTVANLSTALWAEQVVDVLTPDTLPRLSFIVQREQKIRDAQQDMMRLKQAETRYRNIVEDQTDLICRFDRDYQLTFVNRAYAENYGMTPEIMLGMNFFELIPIVDRLRALQHLQSLTIQHPVATSEHRTILPDQTVRWFRWIDRAVFDEQGDLVEYQGVGQDITERKMANGELEALYEATSHLFSASNLTNLAQQIVETVMGVVDLASCDLFLVNSEEQIIETIFRHAPVYTPLTMHLDANGAGLIAHAVRTKTIVYEPDVRQSPIYLLGDRRIRTELVIPLQMASGVVIGALDLQSNVIDAFDERTRRILVAYADRASLAIANWQIYDQKNRYAQVLEQHVSERTQELKVAKERVEAILNGSPDGILLFDADSIIHQTNDSLCELLGCEEKVCIGNSLALLIDPSHREHVNQACYELMRDHRVRRLDIRALRHNGAVFDAELSLALAHGDLFVGILRDITERKQAELALYESEERFRQVVENFDHVLYIRSGDDRRMLYFNPAAEAFTGLTREQVYENSDVINDLFHPDDRDTIAAMRQQPEYMVNGRLGYEYRMIVPPNQRVRWVHNRMFPIRDNEGNISLLIGIVEDITERKEAEHALKSALLKEQELSELKSRFVSMASHEFRTPLATIQAINDTLILYRHRLTDDKIEERLRKINDQTGHLKDIMEDVLLLARMQARRMEYNPVLLDLNALCRVILDELLMQPHLQHDIQYRVSGTPYEMWIDRKLMRQIIVNLVSNAIKYSPTVPMVEVHLDYESTQVTLEIRDYGIGIPASDLPHLFEPFHRAQNVGTISGTGLGLVITKESVELHQGTITVSSQVNEGSVFIVQLPRHPHD